jgi:malonyl-CoA decarboxylase
MTTPEIQFEEPLWDRTLRKIRRIWPIGKSAALKDAVDLDLPESDWPRLRKNIDACLEGRGGEVSARTRAAELGETYLVLNTQGRRNFLELLAREYDIDNDQVEDVIVRRQQCSDENERRILTHDLQKLLEPPRSRLLRQFNDLEAGVKFLVDLRAELIPWSRGDETLKNLDHDVYSLLASWFDVGFLDLQRITWNTPAALLEKLTEYEAVHKIRSWQDLKNRLGEDRRCYAYFHPRMPDEPLIFVEVALVNGIAGNIQELLDEQAPVGDPQQVNTAVFYSISNCQAGLAGVSFGNFLIKRVAADLSAKLPNLKTFATLSPIPGFVGWLNSHIDELDLSEHEHSAIQILNDNDRSKSDLRKLLKGTQSETDADVKNILQPVLKRLCARYLLHARRGDKAYDRVAHFHFSNGAQIEQINWAADLSDNGLEQSAGLMVNYLYQLTEIEARHEAYTSQCEISASAAVRKLDKPK